MSQPSFFAVWSLLLIRLLALSETAIISDVLNVGSRYTMFSAVFF